MNYKFPAGGNLSKKNSCLQVGSIFGDDKYLGHFFVSEILQPLLVQNSKRIKHLDAQSTITLLDEEPKSIK